MAKNSKFFSQSAALISARSYAIRQTSCEAPARRPSQEARKTSGRIGVNRTESNCCTRVEASARLSSSTRHPAASGHRAIEDSRLFIYLYGQRFSRTAEIGRPSGETLAAAGKFSASPPRFPYKAVFARDVAALFPPRLYNATSRSSSAFEMGEENFQGASRRKSSNKFRRFWRN